MRFRVVGIVMVKDKRQRVCYDEFSVYKEAYDYKLWLEDSSSWKQNPGNRPYIVIIEEVDIEDRTTGYEDIDNMDDD